ncbi:hypothetical protein [Psychrobacillus sp. FSL K6-1267]|uniref:hypothetical protein n=1 Tax=Psychrobacillus sp. FSL K6-1267 TaxID=2921543 RepID=UPI0030F5DE3B
MKLVEVLKVPVRYKGETYKKGDSFEMDDDHFNEELVKVTGEVKQEDNPFDGMSIDELKVYAEQQNIDIGNATTEKGIIKKIEEAHKTE